MDGLLLSIYDGWTVGGWGLVFLWIGEWLRNNGDALNWKGKSMMMFC
jgi:hypothetical protein